MQNQKKPPFTPQCGEPQAKAGEPTAAAQEPRRDQAKDAK